MPATCLLFSIHHARHLRRYTVFNESGDYFDDDATALDVRDAAEKSYRPLLAVLIEQARRHEGRFRVGLAVSGSALDLIGRFAPDVIDRLHDLNATDCADFAGRASEGSLAFLYSGGEFAEQVNRQRGRIERTFGRRPSVFRPVGYSYNNALADWLAGLGYAAVMADGVDPFLAGRGLSDAYRPPGGADLKLMLRHRQLTNDVSLRFSDPAWPEHPLSAETFAGWVNGSAGRACHLGFAATTFGRAQPATSGIFDFLSDLPDKVLAGGGRFATPAEAANEAGRVDQLETLDVPYPVSGTDTELDLSAWLGNAMQSNASHELYALEGPIKTTGDEKLLDDWRSLTAATYVYHMGTKPPDRPGGAKRCLPYESPYDAYINFMNILAHLRKRVEG